MLRNSLGTSTPLYTLLLALLSFLTHLPIPSLSLILQTLSLFLAVFGSVVLVLCYGARLVRVVRRADFSPDLEAIEAAVRRERPKLIFIASPNNPDGSCLEPAALERLLDLPVLVVLEMERLAARRWPLYRPVPMPLVRPGTRRPAPR